LICCGTIKIQYPDVYHNALQLDGHGAIIIEKVYYTKELEYLMQYPADLLNFEFIFITK
jgi:hypothetical protein